MLVRSDTCGNTSKAYDVTHASDVTTELSLMGGLNQAEVISRWVVLWAGYSWSSFFTVSW